MKTLTPEQREQGFTELEGVLGEGGVGGAHLMSFLAGIAHAEKILASEKQEQSEPVAWMWEYDALGGWHLAAGIDKPANDGFSRNVKPLYLHPAPRKPFVRLTDEEICIVMDNVLEGGGWIDVARAIEDALEEKNK